MHAPSDFEIGHELARFMNTLPPDTDVLLEDDVLAVPAGGKPTIRSSQQSPGCRGCSSPNR